MAFDGIVTKHIVDELNSCLLNAKINKVFEPNKNELLFGIYCNGKNYLLNACIDSINYRLNLTTNSKPNPLNAPSFCMLLRKHLIGMRIKKIYNYDLERIVTIELEGYNELNDIITKKLIIELMGKHSNIILLNEKNMIIDALRHFDTFSKSNRNILPAHQYIVPSNSKANFINSNFDEFLNNVYYKNSNNIVNSIVNTYAGISKTFVYYAISKLNVDINTPSKSGLEKLYNYITDIINSPNVKCIDYSISNKNDYTIDLANSILPLNINFFMDDFYSKKEANDDFINYRNSILKLILKELNKYKKRLNNINIKLDECSKMDLFKLYGELITANLYRIDNNINLDKIELENYYDNNKKLTIPLDISISPSYNANKYFKKYNKLKNALQIVSIQKKETAKEINYIESIIYSLENAKSISDVHTIYEEIAENIIFKDKLQINKKSKIKKQSKKKKQEDNILPKPIILDGYTIYIGKNNKQNDYLTLKFAHAHDIWFHTKDVHGSHVILKTNGKEPTQEIINKCASLAAFYSKATNSSNVAVDYTLIKYVKKSSSSKPGMVIYTNYSTVNVHPNNWGL